MNNKQKEKLFSVTIHDCRVDTYRGSSKGGQNHYVYKKELESAIRRIQEKLSIMPNGCIEYTGARSTGYGVIRLKGSDGKFHNEKVHRLVYSIFNGPIEDNMVIMHKCDNRGCCNPEHLDIGTMKDNIQDAITKKRMLIGSTNGISRLVETDIPVIRNLAKKGMKQKEIGRIFGVHRRTITDVLIKKTWTHV